MDKVVMDKKEIQVKCPVCGYVMPLRYRPDAQCSGIFVACKGRNCRNIFEVKVRNGQQIK